MVATVYQKGQLLRRVLNPLIVHILMKLLLLLLTKQGRSLHNANTHVRTREICRIFLKIFLLLIVKAICSVMTWPCVVQNYSSLPRCYSPSFLHEKYNSLRGMWQIKNILEMFATFVKYLPSGDPRILRIHAKRRGTGEIHKHICQIRQRRTKDARPQRIDPDWLSFLTWDLSGKFSHSKAILFLVFSLHKCRKSLSKDYVAQLGNHGPDHADDNPGKLK